MRAALVPAGVPTVGAYTRLFLLRPGNSSRYSLVEKVQGQAVVLTEAAMPAGVHTTATVLDSAAVALRIYVRPEINYAIGFSSSAVEAVKAGKAATTPDMVVRAAKAAEFRALPDSQAKEARAAAEARAVRNITADPEVVAPRAVPSVVPELRAI